MSNFGPSASDSSSSTALGPHQRATAASLTKISFGAVADRHGLLEHAHHRVHPHFDALEVGEEAGDVERERDPAGEGAGEQGVVLVVAPARPGLDERHHADEAAARAQGDGEIGADAERAQEREVLGRMGHLLEVVVADEPIHEQVGRVPAGPDDRGRNGRVAPGDSGSTSAARGPCALTASRSTRPAEIASIMQRSASSGTAISVISATASATVGSPPALAATRSSRSRRRVLRLLRLDHHRHIAGKAGADDDEPVTNPEVDGVVVVIPEPGGPDDDHGQRGDDRRGADIAAERGGERDDGEEPDDDQVGWVSRIARPAIAIRAGTSPLHNGEWNLRPARGPAVEPSGIDAVTILTTRFRSLVSS